MSAIHSWRLRNINPIQELRIFSQLPITKKLRFNALPRAHPETIRESRVMQEAPYRFCVRIEVRRIVDQKPMNAMLNLLQDAAHAARYYRPGLPHRLRDGKAKPFLETFLDHDSGMALKSIYHCRIFGDVSSR